MKEGGGTASRGIWKEQWCRLRILSGPVLVSVPIVVVVVIVIVVVVASKSERGFAVAVI
jgi:hypothetical protein